MLIFVVTVERLCHHHDITSFDCGKPSWNDHLNEYVSAASDGGYTTVFVAVGKEGRVEGYLSVEDYYVEWMGQTSLYMALPALAIDRRSQHSGVLLHLARKLLDVIRLREERTHPLHFEGLAVHPATPSIQRLIQRRGYEDVLGDWRIVRLPGGVEFRRKDESDRWHYCPRCSSWPTSDFKNPKRRPILSECCDDCMLLDIAGTCG